jgi:hypothetical protein
VAWTDLLLGAIVMGDVHRARLHNADVPHLTALASDKRLDAGSRGPPTHALVSGDPRPAGASGGLEAEEQMTVPKERV